jgi:hypothetical protein
MRSLIALLCVVSFASAATAQFRPPSQRTSKFARAGELGGAASQFLGQYQMEAQNFNTVDNEIFNNLNSLMPQFGELMDRARAMGRASQPRALQRPSMAAGVGSGIGAGGAPRSKPFAGASNGPTVSPFLLLDDSIGGDPIDSYNTLVRPMLQQQRTNQQFQQQSMELTRRVQQLSARPAFEPTGDENTMPTGHPSTFGNTLQFYPLRNAPR